MNSPFDGLGHSLFEISSDIIIVVDDDGLITSANPSALKYLGFEVKNLQGARICEILNVPDKEGGNSAIENLHWLISQCKSNRCVEIKTCSGHIFNSRVSIGEPVERADGCFQRLICIHDSAELGAAKAEQDHYKRLLDAALGAIPDGFAVYDEDDRLQIFNKAYADVYRRSGPILQLGEKFENILRFGLNAGQYIDAGETDESREIWLKKRLELHKNPTGPDIQNVGDRWLRVEERKLEDGRTVGIRADITQLVEAKSAAEMLGNVLDNMAAPISFFNLQTEKFEYGNKAFLKKIQYTLEEFVELHPNDINVTISKKMVADFIQRAVKNPGQVFSMRSVHRRKDGTTFPCIINTVCEADENPKRLFSFIQDGTVEAKMRDELEVQRAQLETLVHNLPCLMTHSKPDTTILFVNEDYADFFGVTSDGIIGQKFSTLVSKQDSIQVMDGIYKLTEKSPVFTRESHGYNQRGEPYTLLWTNRMLYREGKPYELVSVGRDITDMKNAEIKIEKQAHELKLRNRALEQFAGIVSHDLRSPLRHIRMFGEMLMHDYENGNADNYPQYIAKMRDGVLRMERLIECLLEFSQVAYKQVNRSTFTLSKAIEEAKDNLAGPIADHQADVALSGEDIKLQLDYVLFVRLLENLIDNSVKYAHESRVPKVSIEGRGDGKALVITITDNGIGIPAEHNDRIFNVFQRLHIDEKKYKGTGIGLALAKRIIEGHNGSIELDTKFNGGAKFIISFPLVGQ